MAPVSCQEGELVLNSWEGSYIQIVKVGETSVTISSPSYAVFLRGCGLRRLQGRGKKSRTLVYHEEKTCDTRELARGGRGFCWKKEEGKRFEVERWRRSVVLAVVNFSAVRFHITFARTFPNTDRPIYRSLDLESRILHAQQ